jgi:hypothetical protein
VQEFHVLNFPSATIYKYWKDSSGVSSKSNLCRRKNFNYIRVGGTDDVGEDEVN